MRLTQVDLENVKSYRQQSILFTEGTNAICGANGAGKSTLLEAIGFALFGHSPFSSQGQFVREGEKTATITVHLADDDDRIYQVVRKCGSSNQYYVYDPEIEQKVADGVGDTAEWLREFFGVQENADLGALFRDAVGVTQGLLAAPFLEPASRRKGMFDPLLRVDEYKQVWDSLLDPLNLLKDWIVERDTEIAGYEAQVEALPELEKTVHNLAAEIESGEQREVGLAAELDEVSRSKRDLEAIKDRLEAMERQVARAEGDVAALRGRLDEAQAALTRAQEAKGVVEETASGHQSYLAAQERLTELEAQRQERDRLKEAIQGHTTSLQLAQEKTQALESSLQEIAAAEAQVERLRPQVEEQDRLDKALEQARLDVQRLADMNQRLAQEQRRLESLRHKLSQAQADQAARVQIESEVGPLQEQVDALDERCGALATGIAAGQGELRQLVAQGQRAAKQLSAAQQQLIRAQGLLGELEDRRSRVQDGLAEREQMDRQVVTLRGELESLDARHNELTAQAAACQAELEQIAVHVDVLEGTDQAQCPVCDAPLTPEHRTELLAQRRERQSELEEMRAAIQSEQTQVKKSRNKKLQAVRDLEGQLQDLPRPAEAQELDTRIEAQREQVTASEKAHLDAQTEAAAIAARQQDLDVRVKELQTQRDEVETERREKQEALESLEMRLYQLSRPEEVTSLTADVSRQDQAVSECMHSVETWSGAPAQVERLEGDLMQLGDPRRAYQRAGDKAAQRPQVEQEQQVTRGRIADLEAQLTQLGKQMSVYAGLDTQITDERAHQAAHRAAHQRYLEHLREAEAYPERSQSIDDLSARLEETRLRHARLSQEREGVAATYDADAYSRLVDQHSVLNEERATLNERLRIWRERLEEERGKIERLKESEGELHVARDKRDELEDVRGLLDHLRHVLRDAGPKITQALVETISLQASRMYADIMADHTARLCWTEDYEVLLNAEGRERTFQQLSGGEQMAASLAVRLALLREVSTINVAFFDEPTANLDETRRDNLAEQIMNVKGFSQLFVISHDDTFERDTDHVVRVVKENGVSRVEG